MQYSEIGSETLYKPFGRNVNIPAIFLWWLVLCVNLIWLRVPKQSVKHFSMYFWGCFHKRLAFESVNYIKRSLLPNLDRPEHYLMRCSNRIIENYLFFENWHSHLLFLSDIRVLVLSLWAPGLMQTGPPNSQSFQLKLTHL
jgi:hypothetical protein